MFVRVETAARTLVAFVAAAMVSVVLIGAAVPMNLAA